MKLFCIAAIAASVLCAEEVKKPEAPPQLTERTLTETESLKLQLAAAKVQIIRDKYKTDEMDKELGPIRAEQNAVAMGLCRSVGIPEDLIQAQCGIFLGTGLDGKPQLGPDGKALPARVWWNKPAPPATGSK